MLIIGFPIQTRQFYIGTDPWLLLWYWKFNQWSLKSTVSRWVLHLLSLFLCYLAQNDDDVEQWVDRLCNKYLDVKLIELCGNYMDQVMEVRLSCYLFFCGLALTDFIMPPSAAICLWPESCPLCIFHNTSWIHFICTHLIQQLQKVCVSCVKIFAKFQTLNFWHFF